VTACLIGVDLGTTGGKAVLVDENGEVRGTAWREYPMHRPQAGWAENDPEDWVRATAGMIRDVVASSGVSADSVKAVSIVAQRDPVVLLDGAGEVLTPSISWLDRRDQGETDALFRELGRTHIIEVTGVVPVPALTLPNLVWTRRHLPDVWRRARHALFVKDYVIYRLTGEIATDYSTQSRSLLNAIATNSWSEEICGFAEIPVELLPEIKYDPWAPRAVLDARTAESLGLRAGTILSAGGGDDQAAALGSGAVAVGDISAGTGTASCWRVVSDRAVVDPAGRADLSVHVAPGRYLYEMTIAGTGLSLRWFRDIFGGIAAEGTAPSATYDALVEEAMTVPPGADGLIFYPYLDGSRLPYFNEDANGVFFGITATHRRAHFVRAILEGVAYQYPALARLVEEYSSRVGLISIVDGEARSRAWNSIKADVLGMPIRTTRTVEAAAIGSAILAGVAGGVFASVEVGVEALVSTGEVFEPDPARHEVYERERARYEAVYRHLDVAFHDARLAGREPGAVKEGAIGMLA
jgi:xylulokinase